MSEIEQFLLEHRGRFEEELCQLLRIPSVSTDSRHAADVQRAGQWVADQFQTLGLATELVSTDRHPIVFAETPAVPGAVTVLVYGHFDVQPPDPLDEWTSPPFEPTRRDGNIYARGATDDKGQMFTHIKGAEAWLRTAGKLPVQLKFLIEGEEEVGSASLYRYLEENADRLQCDIAVISDTSQFAPGQPAITYALRGISYYQLQVIGPRQDLHSGTFGGAVTNPINALARLLTSLVDERGRVTIPEFYDDVLPLLERERSLLASLPFDERRFMQQIGVDSLSGEEGFTTLERRWARPTFDVHGIWGGYQQEGAKTVLPAKATAKFSFRLVPNQDPKKITASLRRLLADHCPPGTQLQLQEVHSGQGIVMSLDSPYMSAAVRAIEIGFGRSPVFIREGGSIPVVNVLKNKLGVDTLLLGWGLDDDNMHSPNEKFSLTDFHRGIKASACLWRELGRISS